MDDPNIELWKQIRGDGEESRWGPEDDPYEDKREERERIMQEHEQAKAVLNMQNKIDLYEMALQKIKDEQGVVCQKFESCKHASCRSSYASWAIADIALKECSE